MHQRHFQTPQTSVSTELIGFACRGTAKDTPHENHTSMSIIIINVNVCLNLLGSVLNVSLNNWKNVHYNDCFEGNIKVCVDKCKKR